MHVSDEDAGGHDAATRVNAGGGQRSPLLGIDFAQHLLEAQRQRRVQLLQHVGEVHDGHSVLVLAFLVAVHQAADQIHCPLLRGGHAARAGLAGDVDVLYQLVDQQVVPGREDHGLRRVVDAFVPHVLQRYLGCEKGLVQGQVEAEAELGVDSIHFHVQVADYRVSLDVDACFDIFRGGHDVHVKQRSWPVGTGTLRVWRAVTALLSSDWVGTAAYRSMQALLAVGLGLVLRGRRCPLGQPFKGFP